MSSNVKRGLRYALPIVLGILFGLFGFASIQVRTTSGVSELTASTIRLPGNETVVMDPHG